jgi:hypothetical protein
MLRPVGGFPFQTFLRKAPASSRPLHLLQLTLQQIAVFTSELRRLAFLFSLFPFLFAHFPARCSLLYFP